MPLARLQPLPFPDRQRIISLLDQDPSLLEPGLRLVARDVPLPRSAGGLVLDVLAVDARGRAAAIRVVESASSSTVQEALAARDWLRSHLPTLQALCPPLSGSGPDVRSLLLTGRAEPAAVALLSRLVEPRPEIIEVGLYESPSGLAVAVRPAAAEEAPGEAPAARAVQVPLGFRGDPLAGIPLTAEETAEFRRAAGPPPPRDAAARAAPATRSELPAAGAFVEN